MEVRFPSIISRTHSGTRPPLTRGPDDIRRGPRLPHEDSSLGYSDTDLVYGGPVGRSRTLSRGRLPITMWLWITTMVPP